MNFMGGGVGQRNIPTGSQRIRPNFSGDIVPKGYKTGQLQQYTPEQLQLLQHLMSFVGPESFLSRLAGGDESQFEQMEAPALRQFSGTLGNIANRLGYGSGGKSLGTLRSSGAQNLQSAAGSNFAQDLAANRQNLQRQALHDLMGFSESLLGQRPYERYLTEKTHKPSFTDQLLGGAGSFLGAAGKGIGSFFGF